MLVAAAMKVGFSGGLVVDFPHSTRAKKYYLVLMVGQAAHLPQARGLNGEGEDEYEMQVGGWARLGWVRYVGGSGDYGMATCCMPVSGWSDQAHRQLGRAGCLACTSPLCSRPWYLALDTRTCE